MSAGILTHRAAEVRAVIEGRRRRMRRRGVIIAALVVAVVLVFFASLMIGRSFYGPVDVFRVIFGQTVPGASFTSEICGCPARASDCWPASPSASPASPFRPCCATRSLRLT